MRFVTYINENYKKALNIGEPETGSKYSDDAVARRIKEIEAGIKDANKLPDDEAKESILADLEDKLDKWQNVDQETEAPKAAAPPEGEEEGEEAGEEAGEEEADADAEEEEAAKDKEDKEKDREDKAIEKDDKATDRDEKREKEREKKEKEREKQKEKGMKKEGLSFKDYMHLNEAKEVEPIFNITNVKDVCKQLQKGIKAPFVNIRYSELGGAENVSILMVISLDEKSTWLNNILENSRYFRMSLNQPNILEQFVKNYTITKNFRKSRPKNIKMVIDKINAYIKQV